MHTDLSSNSMPFDLLYRPIPSFISSNSSAAVQGCVGMRRWHISHTSNDGLDRNRRNPSSLHSCSILLISSSANLSSRYDDGYDIAPLGIQIRLSDMFLGFSDQDRGAGFCSGNGFDMHIATEVGKAFEVHLLRFPVPHHQDNPGLATRTIDGVAPSATSAVVHPITPRCLIAGTASNLPSRYLLRTSVSFLMPSKSERQ